MHRENLSRLVGGLVAFSFAGFCWAGVGAPQQVAVVAAPVAAAPAKAGQTQSVAVPSKQPEITAGWWGGDGNDPLLTALLGLGLLTTVVYRARSA